MQRSFFQHIFFRTGNNKNNAEFVLRHFFSKKNSVSFIQHHFFLKNKTVSGLPSTIFLQKNGAGFTLIELLIVIAIVAVLAVIVFVSVNPLARFQDARNSRRAADVKSIVDAVRMYQIENKGLLPSGIDASWRMLGTAGSGCGIFCGGSSTGSGSSGSGGTSNNSITFSSQTDFSSGVFSSTQWSNSNLWLELISPNMSGTYTSPIIDSNYSGTVWSSFSYVPQFPSGKELPNNGQSETAYPSGNANMSSNLLLMHFNESSGATTFQDTSGNNLNGICTGAYCPTVLTLGKINGGIGFDGVNDSIQLPNTTALDPKTGNFTWSGWLKFGGFTGKYRQIYYANAGGGSDGLGFLLQNIGDSMRVEIKGSLGSRQVKLVSTANYLNAWHNWVFVLTSNDYKLRTYVDGVLISTIQYLNWGSINSLGTNLRIGSYNVPNANAYDGQIDEVAIFSRALSVTEILNNYKRGASRLKFQVRSCTDSVCASSSFVGPDGTSGSYYSELNNSTISLPTFSLSNVATNQYFQFKTFLETDKSVYSPELKSLEISNITTVNTDTSPETPSSTGGNQLQSACLDLSSTLGNKLSPIPQDPSVGSSERTYYALNREDNGKINAQACGAEGITITAGR